MGFFKKKQPAAPSGPVYGPVEYVICGLGNPGSKYGNTRHNIGFCALDVLAKDCGAAVERSRFHAMTGEAMLDGRHVLLMKPATYMNLSGQAVQEALQFYKLPPERLIVLSDDISLPVGKRLRRRSQWVKGYYLKARQRSVPPHQIRRGRKAEPRVRPCRLGAGTVYRSGGENPLPPAAKYRRSLHTHHAGQAGGSHEPFQLGAAFP